MVDPDTYGGEEALTVRWARLFLQRSDVRPRARPVAGKQRLFLRGPPRWRRLPYERVTTDIRRAPSPTPQIGDAFNPYGRFRGLLVPEQVCRYRGLSSAAKLIYGRLCRYAGKDGNAYPSVATLGREVGLSQTQAREHLHSTLSPRALSARKWRKVIRQTSTCFYGIGAFEGDIGQTQKVPPRKTGGVDPCGYPEGLPAADYAQPTPADYRRAPLRITRSNPTDIRR